MKTTRFPSSTGQFHTGNLGLGGLPWLVPGPVSLSWIKSVSLGMVNIFIPLSREILLVFNPISLWFKHQKLSINTILSYIFLLSMLSNNLLKRNYLISCVISYEVQPTMPFWWYLRCVVAIFLSIFNPPVSSC